MLKFAWARWRSGGSMRTGQGKTGALGPRRGLLPGLHQGYEPSSALEHSREITREGGQPAQGCWQWGRGWGAPWMGGEGGNWVCLAWRSKAQGGTWGDVAAVFYFKGIAQKVEPDCPMTTHEKGQVADWLLPQGDPGNTLEFSLFPPTMRGV